MGGAARVVDDSNSKRWLIWPTLILAVLGFLAAVILFAWPQDTPDRVQYDVGSVGAFAVGSVTTMEEGAFHLVRLSDENFVALSWRDPHRGCTVPWKADFLWPDPETGQATQGWFRDPCGGSTYDREGHRVFGPAPRDLDRYSLTIEGDQVIVDTGRYVCGQGPGGAPCVSP